MDETTWLSMTPEERKEWARKDNEREDMEIEPEDPRDITDRMGTNPY